MNSSGPQKMISGPDKELRIPVFVARRTGLFRLFRSDPPYMRLMALVAFHIHILYVKPVPAYIDNILVAPQAVTPVRSRSIMGLVTLIAEELHRGVVRHIDLDRPFNRILIRHVMGHIQSSAGYQFPPYLLAPVTEEAF